MACLFFRPSVGEAGKSKRGEPIVASAKIGGGLAPPFIIASTAGGGGGITPGGGGGDGGGGTNPADAPMSASKVALITVLALATCGALGACLMEGQHSIQ
jgi:hypothetical protein